MLYPPCFLVAITLTFAVRISLRAMVLDSDSKGLGSSLVDRMADVGSLLLCGIAHPCMFGEGLFFYPTAALTFDHD